MFFKIDPTKAVSEKINFFTTYTKSWVGKPMKQSLESSAVVCHVLCFSEEIGMCYSLFIFFFQIDTKNANN